MGANKLFKCSVFNPLFQCTYSVSGEEEYVVEQASFHEEIEHDIEDSPENRQKIRESLIDSDD